MPNRHLILYLTGYALKARVAQQGLNQDIKLIVPMKLYHPRHITYLKRCLWATLRVNRQAGKGHLRGTEVFNSVDESKTSKTAI